MLSKMNNPDPDSSSLVPYSPSKSHRVWNPAVADEFIKATTRTPTTRTPCTPQDPAVASFTPTSLDGNGDLGLSSYQTKCGVKRCPKMVIRQPNRRGLVVSR